MATSAAWSSTTWRRRIGSETPSAQMGVGPLARRRRRAAVSVPAAAL